MGGKDFTLIGRPALDPSTVTVNATVVEKTVIHNGAGCANLVPLQYTQPEVKFFKVSGKKIENLQCKF